MVAKTVALPNIRELFVPDPGYVMCDCDLKQADAQVVAWEADDAKLKEIFRDPTADLHNENCKDIFDELNDKKRKLAKAGVHATNYGAHPPTLARALGITVHEADRFQRKWFGAHPGIKEWHRRVELQLQRTRTIYNKFGNRKVFFDRIDTILPQALAWIPQSTVALVIDRGLCNLAENMPEVQLLLQVHDSLVFQVRKERINELKPYIKQNLEIMVPYDDPLIIPVDLAISDSSWGECEKAPWN